MYKISKKVIKKYVNRHRALFLPDKYYADNEEMIVKSINDNTMMGAAIVYEGKPVDKRYGKCETYRILMNLYYVFIVNPKTNTLLDYRDIDFGLFPDGNLQVASMIMSTLQATFGIRDEVMNNPNSEFRRYMAAKLLNITEPIKK